MILNPEQFNVLGNAMRTPSRAALSAERIHILAPAFIREPRARAAHLERVVARSVGRIGAASEPSRSGNRRLASTCDAPYDLHDHM